MTLIFAILMVAVVVSIGGYILSLYLNSFVFVDLIYNLQKINFIKNQNIIVDQVVYQYGGVYTGSSDYNKIFGLYGFILPGKNGLGTYDIEKGGRIYFSGEKIDIIFKDLNKGYKLQFSGNSVGNTIPPGRYYIDIISYNDFITGFSLYISGDNIRKSYLMDYLSGTFLVKIDEFLHISQNYSKLILEKYPKFLIDLIKLYNISKNWERYNFIHFNASGVNKKGMFYFYTFKNINPPKNIIIEGFTFTGCDKILRGIYYNGSKYYYPLYSGDLLNLQSQGIYTGLILSGGIYSNCDNDIAHLFGQIDYYYTPDGVIKTKLFSLYAGRQYDFDINAMQNITGSTLGLINHLGNDYVIGFIYDDSIGIGFIGGKFDKQNIFKDLLNYVNTNSIISSVNSLGYDKINFVNSIGHAFRKLFY